MTTLEMKSFKLDLMEELMSIDNKETLTKIRTYIRKIRKQEESTAEPVPPCCYTVEEAKRLLEESEERLQKGEFTTHEAALKQMAQWI